MRMVRRGLFGCSMTTNLEWVNHEKKQAVDREQIGEVLLAFSAFQNPAKVLLSL